MPIEREKARQGIYLGNLWGIRLTVNRYFLMLLVVYAFLGVLLQGIIIFCLVLWHELGHALVARRLGLKVGEIEFWPFGGMAYLEDGYSFNPRTETLISLAGPMGNLILVFLGRYLQWRGLSWPGWEFFIQTNLVLAVFNLFPALPLDGGRVLRALRSMAVGWNEATREAARLGQAFGAFLALGGTVFLFFRLSGINLPLVGFFIFWAASRELVLSPYLLTRSLLKKQQELSEGKPLVVAPLAVDESTSLGEVCQMMRSRRYCLVFVVDAKGRLSKVLEEGRILDGFFTYGSEIPVGKL